MGLQLSILEGRLSGPVVIAASRLLLKGVTYREFRDECRRGVGKALKVVKMSSELRTIDERVSKHENELRCQYHEPSIGGLRGVGKDKRSSDIGVLFQPHGKRVLAQERSTMLEGMKLLGVDASSLCSRKGVRGERVVRIQQGPQGSTPPTENGLGHVSEEGSKAGIRLAWQAGLTVPSAVLVPASGRIERQRLQTEGYDVVATPDPPAENTLCGCQSRRFVTREQIQQVGQ